jgi:antitoxin component of MazEF toxin-antitoxin module
MAIVKKLTRYGDSRGVILPKAFLDQLGIDEHEEVELSLQGDHIVVAPHRHATAAEFDAATERIVVKRRGMLKRLAKR